MRSFGSGMAMISVGFLVAGIASPHLADRFLQMLLATLAIGFVGARMYRLRLPVQMAHETYSPFERRRDEEPPSSPAVIGRLASQLGAAADPHRAARVPIPGAAAEIVFAEASRRLAEHHGLSLRRRSDHGRIRGLLSEPTWALISRSTVTFDVAPEPTAYVGPVPLSELDRILEDLENL